MCSILLYAVDNNLFVFIVLAAQVSAVNFPAIEKFGINPQPIFRPTTEKMQFSKLIWNLERWVSEQPNARLLLCTVSIQLTVTAKQIEEMKESRIQRFMPTVISPDI